MVVQKLSLHKKHNIGIWNLNIRIGTPQIGTWGKWSGENGEGKMVRGKWSGEKCPGGNVPRGECPGGNVQGGMSRGEMS